MWAASHGGEPAPLTWIVHDTRALVPTRASQGAAGYDLFTMEETTLPAGCYTKIPTGIGIHKMARGTFGLIKTRSSTPYKTGLRVIDGVIDQDFENEIKISVFNPGPKPTLLTRASSIAQLVLVLQPILPSTQIVHFKPSTLNCQFAQMVAQPGDILLNTPFLRQCPFKVGDWCYTPSREPRCGVCQTNLPGMGWDVCGPMGYHGSRPETKIKVVDFLPPLFTNPITTGVCFVPTPTTLDLSSSDERSTTDPPSFNLVHGVWSRHKNNLGFGSSS